MGGWGMKGVDTIARIRREHFVRGKTIKEIVRELHVSRNTVRKVLRSGATEFTYEREVQPRPKLGRWKDDLNRLLVSVMSDRAWSADSLRSAEEDLGPKHRDDGSCTTPRFRPVQELR